MKKYCKLVCLILALALLSACGGTAPGASDGSAEKAREIMGDASREAKELVFEPITVSHGEDYVIEWEDEGMEAHIRFLLDKPDGDILHSDVWDVQFLGIFAQRIDGHDMMLTQPPEGWTQFDMTEMLLVENMEDIGRVYGEQEFPDIVTLQDLRHFDSLQIFQTSYVSLTDLSGVEQCPNLVRLILPHSAPASLEPLSKMTWLRNLSLSDCGTLDLAPLAGLPELRDLTLNGCTLVSLEPLASLPSLEILDLTNAEYPSLEPLTRSTVAYLELDRSVNGRETYDAANYEYFTQIPNLVYLELVNHAAFGPEECDALLEGCPKLKYLDIWYTGAADAIADGDYEPDTSRLDAFTTMPY